MDYLTKYYKNLSEKLENELNSLLSLNEELLNEIITREEAKGSRKALAAHQAKRLGRMIAAHNAQPDNPNDWERKYRRDRLAALAKRLGAIPVTDADYRADSAADFHAGFNEPTRVRPDKVEFYDRESETMGTDNVKFFQGSKEQQVQGAEEARTLAQRRLKPIRDRQDRDRQKSKDKKTNR